jgi:hypothetical protein
LGIEFFEVECLITTSTTSGRASNAAPEERHRLIKAEAFPEKKKPAPVAETAE